MDKIFEKISSIIPFLSSDLTSLVYKKKNIDLTQKKSWKIIISCVPFFLLLISDAVFTNLVSDDLTRLKRIAVWSAIFLFVAFCIYVFLWILSIIKLFVTIVVKKNENKSDEKENDNSEVD